MRAGVHAGPFYVSTHVGRTEAQKRQARAAQQRTARRMLLALTGAAARHPKAAVAVSVAYLAVTVALWIVLVPAAVVLTAFPLFLLLKGRVA